MHENSPFTPLAILAEGVPNELARRREMPEEVLIRIVLDADLQGAAGVLGKFLAVGPVDFMVHDAEDVGDVFALEEGLVLVEGV
jgi:hypothetical protein